jgi:hypothetical protein
MLIYAPKGKGTGDRMRQDVYRVAYEEANAELIEIRSRFEQLRSRKERLEGVIAVLEPMMALSASTSAPSPVEMAQATMSAKTEHSSESSAYTFNQVAVPVSDVEESGGGDPFKRRVRNALRTAV